MGSNDLIAAPLLLLPSLSRRVGNDPSVTSTSLEEISIRQGYYPPDGIADCPFFIVI